MSVKQYSAGKTAKKAGAVGSNAGISSTIAAVAVIYLTQIFGEQAITPEIQASVAGVVALVLSGLVEAVRNWLKHRHG